MNTKELFGYNLRNQLDAKRRTQADLARFMKTTPATVSRWISGESLPRPEKMERICTFLSCAVEDLMTDHTKVMDLAPEDVLAEELSERPRLFRLMFYASKMSDDDLDALIQIAEKMK